MRIAMVGSRGIPARSGGVERVVEELTGELTRRGHEVIVYGRAGYLQANHHPVGGKVIVTGGLDGKHLDTITHTASALFDVLRRRVDVVHIHGAGPGLLSWIPALARIPVVFTVHAPDWKRDKWSRWAKMMIWAGLRCGMRLGREVTAVSKPLSEELSEKFSRDVTYIPNAPGQMGHEIPGVLERWGLRKEQYVLHVGRIVPEKRLHLLLKAWGDVESHFPLVVVGDSTKSHYACACKSHSGQGVRFIGPQYGPVLGQLYRNAALIVQPSALEGMSLVLLEGAQYGRCILAGDIPANRQTMGDSILYFPKDGVTELAARINRCLSQEVLRRTMGRKARKFVKQRYSWVTVVDQLERVYRRSASTVTRTS